MDTKNEFDRRKLGYRQSTSAVVIDGSGKFLMVQKNNWKDNEWDIPGGGVDKGESASEAIIRELAEEVGCKGAEILKVSSKVDRYEWPDELVIQNIKKGKEFRGQERTQFLVKLNKDSKVSLQVEELRKVKWIYPNEIEEHCLFPNQLNKMRELLNEFEITK